MVIRAVDHHEPFWLKIDGRWLLVDEDLMKSHPGGTAITTYKDKDATTTFHTFHSGSTEAYQYLGKLKEEYKDKQPANKDTGDDVLKGENAINMGVYDITEEKAQEVSQAFERLRIKVKRDGLLESDKFWYMRKIMEPVGMILLAWYLALYRQQYVIAALFQGLAWQQLGWYFHECCHHQVFKNHYYNDMLSYFSGNFLQGFSSSSWKEQHNVHHAATNVVGRDGDLDLLPFWATVVQDLKLVDSWLLKVLPYQHIYWTIMLPLLRLSWLNTSISFVVSMPASYFETYKNKAVIEQATLALHWTWVVAQLYCLPDNATRLQFFMISQLFSGFLTAHVVTYNHYSADKFPYNSRIMSNYPCLQTYGTRNMAPSPFIDWLWGGLNYQVEHHLFPTMPRHNLPIIMPVVKDFCKEHNIPYMVDDYFTGWRLGVEQFRNVAVVAARMRNTIFSTLER